MIRYIAFLRGINVSGQKIIKMENLKTIFESMKVSNVKTYIQSGNVLFDSSEKNVSLLTKNIEKVLLKSLGYDVTVILRTKEQVVELVALNPFKKMEEDEEKRFSVTLLAEMPSIMPKVPWLSAKKEFEIIAQNKLDLFCLRYPLSNGTFGFPNSIIEKEFKVAATTRNWNTMSKVCKL